MHPEIERDAPGDCPICGMALEPKTISAGAAEDDSELIDMTRRLWIGAVLTLGTPQDVTLQELRVEMFMPADAASEAALVAFAE